MGYHDINLRISPSLVCAGGGQQGDEALSTGVFGNAGMSPPREIEEIGLAPPARPLTPSSPFLSHPLSAYLRETTIGFCTVEHSEEASDGSRV